MIICHRSNSTQESRTAASPTPLRSEPSGVCVGFPLHIRTALLFLDAGSLYSSLHSVGEANPVAPEWIHSFKTYLLSGNYVPRLVLSTSHKLSLKSSSKIRERVCLSRFDSLCNGRGEWQGHREPSMAAVASPVDGTVTLKARGHVGWRTFPEGASRATRSKRLLYRVQTAVNI